ncbi:thioredoxin family protein [Thalassobacillus hwangdonensis]|uniref:Thioredoxin family protein n=1 Tax=Thalassobacillus hwangdonensis TaxID=546108 RepID=A0ABW3KYE2_9BACI
MKNKMIIFIVALLALFGILAFVVNYQNQQASEDNPYGKDNLRQSTIEQLDNPLYQNQMTPDELEEEIDSGDPITVYFYSPECSFCQQTTPVVVPMTQEMDIDLKKLNILEFEQPWQTYNIEGTPTIIHFDNGEEVARLHGAQSQDDFQSFFENEVKGK